MMRDSPRVAGPAGGAPFIGPRRERLARGAGASLPEPTPGRSSTRGAPSNSTRDPRLIHSAGTPSRPRQRAASRRTRATSPRDPRHGRGAPSRSNTSTAPPPGDSPKSSRGTSRGCRAPRIHVQWSVQVHGDSTGTSALPLAQAERPLARSNSAPRPTTMNRSRSSAGGNRIDRRASIGTRSCKISALGACALGSRYWRPPGQVAPRRPAKTSSTMTDEC
jgi:hypothetical protein